MRAVRGLPAGAEIPGIAFDVLDHGALLSWVHPVRCLK